MPKILTTNGFNKCFEVHRDKHVSLHILPEQYDIVGHNLIESIKEVLGDTATIELVDAWTCAYTNWLK
jgi:nitric oxide dioxygenase